MILAAVQSVFSLSNKQIIAATLITYWGGSLNFEISKTSSSASPRKAFAAASKSGKTESNLACDAYFSALSYNKLVCNMAVFSFISFYIFYATSLRVYNVTNSPDSSSYLDANYGRISSNYCLNFWTCPSLFSNTLIALSNMFLRPSKR